MYPAGLKDIQRRNGTRAFMTGCNHCFAAHRLGRKVKFIEFMKPQKAGQGQIRLRPANTVKLACECPVRGTVTPV